jgi:hypothetical protein
MKRSATLRMLPHWRDLAVVSSHAVERNNPMVGDAVEAESRL